MIHHNICWQCLYKLWREVWICFIADELKNSWSFVWDQFVRLTFWEGVYLRNYESDGAWTRLDLLNEVPLVAFQRHALYFELWRFPWETSKWETRRAAIVEKKSTGWLFPGYVLITWNSVKNRSSRMFMYIQTDVWMLTFPLHSVVDCVPNSESLYKGPLTASQTGGVGSSLHLLLL